MLGQTVTRHRGDMQSHQGAGDARLVGDLLDRLDAEYQMRGRKSLRDARYHWEPVRTFLGHRQAAGVTADDLRDYVLWRQKKGLKNATINRELAGLKTAMKLGGLQWPAFKRLEETGLRQGTYTREEVERLSAALPPHLRPVLWFSYHTGRRRGEILQIRWEDVNVEERWVCIRAGTTKTGQPDRIPLIGELYLLVMELATAVEKDASPYLFNYQGKPFKTFSRTWRKALKDSNLTNKLFHDLRRTAATDLIEAGVSEQVAMAITGHQTRAVFARYNIVKSTTVREGLSKLEAYRKRKD
jgi:integrase